MCALIYYAEIVIPYDTYVTKPTVMTSLERFSTHLECHQLKKILTGRAHELNANSLNLTRSNLIYYICEAAFDTE